MKRMNRAELALFALVWLAILAAVTCGAEPPPPIDAPDEIDISDDPMVVAKATFDATAYKWTVIPNRRCFGAETKELFFAAGSKHPQYIVVVSGVKGDKIVGQHYKTIKLKGPGPNPDPGPDPNPNPGPNPTPGKIAVVFVYESADLVKMPKAQAAIVTSPLVRSYLATHCSTTGNEPDRRFMDKDVDVSKMSANFQGWFKAAAAKVKATSKPHVAVTNGKDSAVVEWPVTPEATVELLSKYGGK